MVTLDDKEVEKLVQEHEHGKEEDECKLLKDVNSILQKHIKNIKAKKEVKKKNYGP